jgi:hypothetical protein
VLLHLTQAGLYAAQRADGAAAGAEGAVESNRGGQRAQRRPCGWQRPVHRPHAPDAALGHQAGATLNGMLRSDTDCRWIDPTCSNPPASPVRATGIRCSPHRTQDPALP